MNKNFLFVKMNIWKFCFSWNFTKFHLIQETFIPRRKCQLNVCLNELKFCKVSQNSLSYICWNFQLSIFIHKEIWSVPTIDSSVIDLFTAHNKTYIKCDSNIQPKAFWNWKAVPKNLFSFEEFKWMNSCKFVINTC